jgi:isopenicillin-N N-acyltransferase-like protein
MKVFDAPSEVTPRALGRAHGEAFREMIAEIAEIRLGLVRTLGRFATEAEILASAAAHLPVLEAFDADLHEELLGIAEGSNVDPARIIVLNHYTDLRDIVPSAAGAPVEEDCSAVFARTSSGSLLGQTWDMHGSAVPYVMMLHVPPHGDVPEAFAFSITGCLGMTGLNAHGVGITINNLKSLDARVGVIWPALVRGVLKQSSAEAGRDMILTSQLGSGHHYLVASADAAFGIETSGRREKVVYDGGSPCFVHTNHCLDAEIAEVTVVGDESTTHLRYAHLTNNIDSRPIESRRDLWQRLGSHEGYPKSVCAHLSGPKAPHAMRTCGGLVMDLERVDLWTTSGCMNRARPEVFSF